MSVWDDLESKRLELQASLDSKKSSDERNRLGQFATPTSLAQDIARQGLQLLGPDEPVRFLDPGIGTGSFYSALRQVAGDRLVESASGFEIDDHYGAPASALWAEHGLTVHRGDFTKSSPSAADRVNFLIANPPYVRHHHIAASEKSRLLDETEGACGVRLSGLSGLYCYFLGLAHSWMEEGGIAAWLIPSEFMDVNYGRQVKTYLTKCVTVLQIHRFDPTEGQFADAMVSSAIVWILNKKPSSDHRIKFTFGGSLTKPKISRDVPLRDLKVADKWSRYPVAGSTKEVANLCVGDLFEVRRGIATGDNKFFILSREDIEAKDLPMECFRPVLPSSRHIKAGIIEADEAGWPVLPKQEFLLDTKLPENEIEHRHPTLWSYLQEGKRSPKSVAERYLCRGRKPWYSQENRPAAPIVCTYMGRSKNGGKPFKFYLNHSQATACNVYLMLYPKPQLERLFVSNPEVKVRIWEFLCSVSAEQLIGEGRVYGGGLHKLEPKELKALSMDNLAADLKEISTLVNQDRDLFSVAAE